MGTPDFALKSLREICRAGIEVCAVYTQPDRPAKRGMKLMMSPVKEYAIENNLPVYQPETLKTDEAYEQMRSFGADVAIAVAYGKLIPERMLKDCARLGFINIHGSLLPKYRGAAPVQWTVLNGEKFGGVTAMYLSREMDAGDIIDSVSVPVKEYETYGELYERLGDIGAELLVKTLKSMENGTAKRTPQDASLVSYARPLRSEDRNTDWSQSAESVVNHIHGLNPAPGASAEFGGEKYKLYRAELTGRSYSEAPGSIVAQKDSLEIVCGDGKSVIITEIQAPGGKRMKTSDYLRGHTIKC
jgi:methionyl-tRNA formyltransferase